MHREVLEGKKRVLGEEHSSTLRSVGSLAASIGKGRRGDGAWHEQRTQQGQEECITRREWAAAAAEAGAHETVQASGPCEGIARLHCGEGDGAVH